jgi:putative SOS response-associated peptidase YedK
MCNLYSMVTNNEAIGRLFRFTGGWNRLHVPAVFPDQRAPIVRNGATGDREMVEGRWGMPTPPMHLKPGAIDRGVTNIRNTNSAHWRAWLKPANRCLVPATSFCEPTDRPGPDGRKIWTWFALEEDRPLFAFAGLWASWRGLRGTKKAPDDGEHQLFGFLTTMPNNIVAPVLAKAMPVILTTPEECDRWLSAEPQEALTLQRPLPDAALKIVATGRQEDWPPGSEPAPAGNGSGDPLLI